MKTGKAIVELAQELKRRAESKADFVADTTAMMVTAFEPNKALLSIDGINRDPMTITPHAHRQLSTRLSIPAAYYDRMLTEAPMLWSGNVNHWLTATPERRMVRSLDGQARAFLSDRYRRLDN